MKLHEVIWLIYGLLLDMKEYGVNELDDKYFIIRLEKIRKWVSEKENKMVCDLNFECEGLEIKHNASGIKVRTTECYIESLIEQMVSKHGTDILDVVAQQLRRYKLKEL